MVLEQPLGRFILEELHKTLHGHPSLTDARGEVPDRGHRFSHETEVEDKQHKVPNREGTGADGLAAQQEDETGPEVHRAREHHSQHLGEQAVPERRPPPSLIQRPEMRDDVVLGAGDLHGLDRAKHLGDEVGDPPRRLARFAPVAENAAAQRGHHPNDQHQRDEHRLRDDRIDPEHDGGADDPGQDDADAIHGHLDQAQQLLDIVPEPAHRLAGRVGQRPGAGPAEDALQQVTAQQGRPAEEVRGPGPHTPDVNHDARSRHAQQQGQQTQQARLHRRAVRDRVEDRARHQPDQQWGQPERRPQ